MVVPRRGHAYHFFRGNKEIREKNGTLENSRRYILRLQERIMSKIDILDYIGQHTKLRPVARGYVGKCPIHNGDGENTIWVTPDNNMYHCFSCGSNGNVINFLADMENTSYEFALEKLAVSLNIDVRDDKTYQDEKNVVMRFTNFARNAHKEQGRIIDYLTKDRGISQETADEFMLGYSDGLTIPIRDQNGRTVAMATRQFDKLPKYRNSTNNVCYDKDTLLFNMDKARRLIKDRVYLVEGYLDAISGHQLGIPTVAFCTNTISRDQISLLNRFLRKGATVIYCPDHDDEGHKKIGRIRDYFKDIAPKMNVRVLVIPDELGVKDFNDMLCKGVDINNLATEHIDHYVLSYMLSKCATQEEEYEKVEEYVRTVSSPMIKIDIAKQLAGYWGKELDDVRKWLNAIEQDDNDIVEKFSDTNKCLEDLKDTYSSGGYKTHFSKIDHSIRRIRKRQVVGIAASPYVGKTDFAIEYVLKSVILNKMNVIFFSLEMTKGMLFERIMAKLLSKKLYEIEQMVMDCDPLIASVKEKLDKHLLIVDENNMSVNDIERYVQMANTKNLFGSPVDMIVVDYFTYLKGCNTFEGASAQAMRLKPIAKANNIIFVMLSQLNRETPPWEEPVLQNLRMTGDLEAGLDVAFLLWRPVMEPKISVEKEMKLRWQTMLKIAKARDGIFGATRIELAYNQLTSRLDEVVDG